MGREFKHKAVVFKDYVDNGEVPPDNFIVQERTITEDDLQEGDVLVEVLYLSVDPYMRPLMRHMPKGSKHYAPPFEPGKPLYGGGVGRVEVSKNPEFQEGDIIVGNPMEWAEHVIVRKDQLGRFRKVPDVDLPLSYYVGSLGMPGMTAYAGLKMIAEPKEGETAFVNAASGAVGQNVGQLLKKVYKCRVIGSAGGKQKVELLQQLGFDASINYKEEDEKQALNKHAPDGIDIHWENVGGPILDVALDAARAHARFVMCGMITQYDKSDEDKYGVKNLPHVVFKSIKMQGFLVFEYEKQIGEQFIRDMSGWIKEGKIKVIEDVTPGLENIGHAFARMMRGDNLGKAVVQVGKDPHRRTNGGPAKP